MNVSVIGGTGYVGLVTGIGLAVMGNRVICADIDENRIENLNKGIFPIYEEGLEELLAKAQKNGEIIFTKCIKTAIVQSEILMIAVGTPEGKYGGTDMTQVLRALKAISNHIDRYKIIVMKSTVPVGTGQMIKSFIQSNLKNPSITFDVASNPEFLREGSAVSDFMNPDRIVIGTDNPKAEEALKTLYAPFQKPIVSTDIASAEMIKYACNTYLATRVSFINEIAEICGKVGADVRSVIEGMKYDKRIGGHYLSPGPGFGGPCLSKDLKSLIHFGSRSGANTGVLKAVLRRNELQVSNIANIIQASLASIRNKKVAILGLSFKAGTDDIRNSPSLNLIERLSEANIQLTAYDPVVKRLPDSFEAKVRIASDLKGALENADCAVIMTDWEEFIGMDLKQIYALMRTPVLLDARNAISAKKAKDCGFTYMNNNKTSLRASFCTMP